MSQITTMPVRHVKIQRVITKAIKCFSGSDLNQRPVVD